MNSSAPGSPPTVRAQDVWFRDDLLCARLDDGREIGVPLAWFPRLAHARPEQLENYRLLGHGLVIHWPDVDEDLSVADFLRTGGPVRPCAAVA